MKEFYRCTLCGGIVSEWDVEEEGACKKCSCARIKPSNLSLWEKIIQVCKHPRVWDW